jgi:hypothetical protein
LIERRKIRVEELVGPERGETCQQHESANENVPDRAAEITGEIALEYGANDLGIHGRAV